MSSNPEPGFTAGAAVEISSDEPGFRGSHFAATVVSSLSSPSRSYLVQYETLVDDDSKPLRELAGAGKIRPRPPPEPTRKFGTGDEVDVFHNEGWWQAVVTVELGGGEVEVFFGEYKEEMVFSQKDMRVHRDWINGVWVPPFEEQNDCKPSNGTTINVDKDTKFEPFENGTNVEVSSDDDGLQGAWFGATIVGSLGNDKFLVEYLNLRTDDDKNFLREEADRLFIRPCPPECGPAGWFKLLEEVDCLYNDGWWVGVVSKVFDGEKYFVYFKDTKEEIEFRRSEMRLHQEWIDGKWVRASQALKL